MSARPAFHPRGALREADRELHWIPRHGGGGALAAHLPLIFWLAARLRPRVCVTLGGARGTAHVALCEAMERLGTQGACHGFGPWPGPGAPEPLARHVRARHRGVSTLWPGAAPGDAEEAPGAVDLLVSAAPPSEEAAEAVRSDWLGRMAPGGAIVLRGGAEEAGAEARATLAAGRPWLALPHGGGLTVLAAGDAAPAPVLRLLEPGPGRAADLAALARLGGVHAGADGTADRFRDLWAMTRTLAEQDARWRAALAEASEARDAHAGDAAELARRLTAARTLHREEIEAERRAASARARDPVAASAALQTLGRLARRLTR